MQAGSFQEQQREEQDRLEPEQQPEQAPAGPRLEFGEGQRADRDIGVRAVLVGWAWWRLCLLIPPAVAQSDAQVVVGCGRLSLA